MATEEKVLEADHKAQQWLGRFNALVESGYPRNGPRAETMYRKAQYWLDRLNKLEGNS